MKDFFHDLTPDKILTSVERAGGRATGRIFQLNSMENRVYEIEMEEAESRVGKFYREGRWDEATLEEEHQFLADLATAEIPVVAPLPLENGKTLGKTDDGLFFTVFPKVRGRAPDELKLDQARQLGRLVARMHTVGEQREAPHRLKLTPENYGVKPLEYLLEGGWIAPEVKMRDEKTARELIENFNPLFRNIKTHRIHGDCHLGNLLFNGAAAFFLDFDDMMVGPPAQDIWLATPMSDERESFLEGYEEMKPFDRSTLNLVEPLRALRIIHYSAWVARRWEDPYFQKVFTEFKSYNYWAVEAENLERVLHGRN